MNTPPGVPVRVAASIGRWSGVTSGATATFALGRSSRASLSRTTTIGLSFVPVVILFVLFEDRLRVLRRPRLVLELALLFAAGLSLLPASSSSAPSLVTEALYGDLRSVEGFLSVRHGRAVSGRHAIRDRREPRRGVAGHSGPARRRRAARRTSRSAWSRSPDADRPPAAGSLGRLAHRGHRGGERATSYVGYRGDLPHYLLVSWLVLAIWLGRRGRAAGRPGSATASAQGSTTSSTG